MHLIILNHSSSYAFMQTGSLLSTPSENLIRENKEFLLGLHTSMYRTRDNFDASRNEVTLPAGNAYTLIKETASASFGFSENISFFLNADFDYSELKTPAFQLSNSSFGDSELGFRMNPKLDFINFMFEFGSVLPLYVRNASEKWAAIDRNTSSVNGNGIVEPWVFISPELSLSEHFLLELGAGAKYRSAGFSNQYLGAISVTYKKSRDFFVKLSGKYVDTALEDQYSNSTLTNERSSKIMGQSLLFNSINPTILKASLSSGVYLTDKTFLSAEYSQDVWGKNTASGFLVSVGIGFHFSHDDRISPLAHKKSETFKQYSSSAKITRVDETRQLITIDKGSANGYRTGEVLHIFKVDSTTDASDYGNFITSARIIDVEPNRSTLQIVDIYDLKLIKEGFVVRKPLR